MLYFFYILFISINFLLFSSNGYALDYHSLIEQVQKKKLYQEEQWKLLLHYRDHFFRGEMSQVTGAHFFINPNGNKDPEAEMISTIQILLAPIQGDPDQSFQCRYFARKLWLSEQLGISEDQWPKVNCPLYERYRKILNPESVSFVFSSYYTNNPGSAFGHTLFRINRRIGPKGKRIELLDHGIGYAANVSTDNPLLYAIFGLSGFFNGTFTNLPYYYKIREYNDYESRDLWSYDLNLSPLELELLIRHLWELGETHFDYYFFSQNCAFHLLTVLDAAAPRLKLSNIKSPYLIPADSIKMLFRSDISPPLVKQITYRPSAKKLFQFRFKNLNDIQQKKFIEFTQNEKIDNLVFNIDEEEKITLLDTALEFVDTKYPDNFLDSKSHGGVLKGQILQARSEIPLISSDFSVPLPENERPDKSHPSARVGITSEPGIDFRFALHDIYDSHLGYPEYSEIEFGRMHFSQSFDGDKNKSVKFLSLESLYLFRVSSYNPVRFFEKSISWRAQTALYRRPDECVGCYQGGFTYDVGYSYIYDQSLSSLLIYGFLGLDAYSDFYNFNNISIGPKLGFLSNISVDWKFGVETQGYKNLAEQDSKFQWRLRAQLRWMILNKWSIESSYDQGLFMHQSQYESPGGRFVFTGYYYF